MFFFVIESNGFYVYLSGIELLYSMFESVNEIPKQISFCV